MKRFSITKLSLLALVGIAGVSSAGEGHDHGVPGVVSAPKGGEIKPALGSFFELLKSGEVLKVYPYDDKLKPLPLETLTDVEASVQIPRKKAEKIEVTKHKDHLMMSYDPKGSHRFEVVIKFKVRGEPDSVSYNVEKN